MAQIGWVETDRLEVLWPASLQLDPEALEWIMQGAYEACSAVAPAPQLDNIGQPVIPFSWRLAQVMQAKHIWSRLRGGNAEQVGPDGYAISTFPLVLEARSLLRPKRPAFQGLR
jgi:hypothetical protein